MSDTDVAAYRANGVKWERAAADCAQERRMLRQALTRYGRHDGSCDRQWFTKGVCTCGLDAALGEKNDG